MTGSHDRLVEWVAEWNERALFADGFEDAIIGVCERFGSEPVVAYDRERCIQILAEQFSEEDAYDDDETEHDAYTDAIEYFDFNVAGSYVGENTPVFLTLWDGEE